MFKIYDGLKIVPIYVRLNFSFDQFNVLIVLFVCVNKCGCYKVWHAAYTNCGRLCWKHLVSYVANVWIFHTVTHLPIKWGYFATIFGNLCICYWDENYILVIHINDGRSYLTVPSNKELYDGIVPSNERFIVKLLFDGTSKNA